MSMLLQEHYRPASPRGLSWQMGKPRRSRSTQGDADSAAELQVREPLKHPSLTTSSTVAAPPERSRSVSLPLVTFASMGHLLLRLLWPIISGGDRVGEGHMCQVSPLCKHWEATS